MSKFKASFFIVLILSLCFKTVYTQPTIVEVGLLPEPVSNNAVCEGYVNGVPYVFSFGGIDQTKEPSGIHLRSFRFNIETGESERIVDLPGKLGKIAAGASRIGNIIYIAGGYHVFEDKTEISFETLHRYDINQNTFLEDAPNLPIATDDHVQSVWRDSLIYIISGWSNTTNIVNVQIYNPSTNSWSTGTSIPNSNTYKSFGASGSILNDTIYYFGGASSGNGFPIQDRLRKGIIQPSNPTIIQWSSSAPDPTIKCYRAASTTVGNKVHWIGGSTITYNFDGIAYDGSGGVSPATQNIYFDVVEQKLRIEMLPNVPMDLRGIAKINDSLQYIAGGMLENQEVSNKVFKLEWGDLSSIRKNLSARLALNIFPNPFNEEFSIKSEYLESIIDEILLYDLGGQLILQQKINSTQATISTRNIVPGHYTIHALFKNQKSIQKLIKI